MDNLKIQIEIVKTIKLEILNIVQTVLTISKFFPIHKFLGEMVF